MDRGRPARAIARDIIRKGVTPYEPLLAEIIERQKQEADAATYIQATYEALNAGPDGQALLAVWKDGWWTTNDGQR